MEVGSLSPLSLQRLPFLDFLMTAILASVRRRLPAALTRISNSRDAEQLPPVPLACLPACLRWGNVCVDLLPVFMAACCSDTEL